MVSLFAAQLLQCVCIQPLAIGVQVGSLVDTSCLAE